MVKLVVRWALLAAALLLISHLYSGFVVKTFSAALIASLVLGLLNAVVRPVLILLTLPATIVTLGLFLFVINAVVFYLADWMLDGIATTGFTAALLASLMYSAAAVVIDAALQRVFRED